MIVTWRMSSSKHCEYNSSRIGQMPVSLAWCVARRGRFGPPSAMASAGLLCACLPTIRRALPLAPGNYTLARTAPRATP